MKKIAVLLITMLAIYILGIFMPWWSIVIPPLMAGIFYRTAWGCHALLGFLGGCLTWLTLCLFISTNTDSDLVGMIGEIFQGASSIVLILITGLLGGLYSLVAQLTGNSLYKLFKS